jgi:hypothetical protein
MLATIGPTIVGPADGESVTLKTVGEAFRELCERYALDMRPESLPSLCSQFGVWFPGVR